MPDTPRSILQFPVIAFAFVVEQLRRLPGARQVERRTSWVVTALMFAAFVALVVWMVQRSPQRVSIAELVAGDLAPMQSWIIVTGQLSAQATSTTQYRYALTDPSVPDAVLIVMSEVALPVGDTTVSGTLVGGAGGGEAEYAWVGQLRADPVLAREPDPPWIAIALAGAALFIIAGGRTSYPMFFREARPLPEPETKTMDVGVRRGWPPPAGEPLAGTLALRHGAPAELRVSGEAQQLRLHSAHSSIEVGALRRLFDSEPALVVRPATGEVTISFASADDRDAAFASLVADARATSAG